MKQFTSPLDGLKQQTFVISVSVGQQAKRSLAECLAHVFPEIAVELSARVSQLKAWLWKNLLLKSLTWLLQAPNAYWLLPGHVSGPLHRVAHSMAAGFSQAKAERERESQRDRERDRERERVRGPARQTEVIVFFKPNVRSDIS